MKSAAPASTQFTLSELLFTVVLTFLGMTLLNSVIFTDKPLYGCVLALIATILGGSLTLKISTPNSANRWAMLPTTITVAICLSTAFVKAPEVFAVALLAIGIPIICGWVFGVLLFPRHEFSESEQDARINHILAFILIFFFVGGMLSFDLFFKSSRTPALSTAVPSCCKTIIEAQEIYHRTDHDKDGVLEYAQTFEGPFSLMETTPGARDLYLIDEALCKAAWENAKREPKYGYFFKFLKFTPNGVPFVDEYGDQTRAHAVLAFPAEYDNTGRDSFIIISAGTIYQKDLGPDTWKIADAMTWYAPDSTWVASE